MPFHPFSQFFVLSLRGDKIINRYYRDDIVRGCEELFFRKVKFWNVFDAEGVAKVEAPPCFTVEGINFMYVKKNSLFFVLVSRCNNSPSAGLEFLLKTCRVFKDYCGILSEDSLRKNYSLIYEILDEALDNGYFQTTSTDGLKFFVFNEPVDVEEQSMMLNLANIPFTLTEKKTVASSAARKSIVNVKDRKNEIFVDILEKVNVVFSGNGNVLHSEILGSIVMKSFLNGNPEIRIGLNEDLIVGKHNRPQYPHPNQVVLDQINFGDMARLNEWDAAKTISLFAPDGEFTVLNYRLVKEYNMPFLVVPHVSQIDQFKIEVHVKLIATIPKASYGSNVLVRIPVPKQTSNVAVDFAVGSDTTYEYKQNERAVMWGIKKFLGQSEQVIRLKIALTAPLAYDVRKHVGPITLKFEIPMHNVSGLQVKFLKIDQKAGNPARWVRYITQANSYVCRCTN